MTHSWVMYNWIKQPIHWIDFRHKDVLVGYSWASFLSISVISLYSKAYLERTGRIWSLPVWNKQILLFTIRTTFQYIWKKKRISLHCAGYIQTLGGHSSELYESQETGSKDRWLLLKIFKINTPGSLRAT